MKKFTLNSLALLTALVSTGAFAQLALPATSTPRPPGAPALAPGLYVAVIDGLVNVRNPAGTSTFAAGQFGFTPSLTQPPVMVPRNPGIVFTPPKAFTVPSASGAPTGNKAAAIDCVVR